MESVTLWKFTKAYLSIVVVCSVCLLKFEEKLGGTIWVNESIMVLLRRESEKVVIIRIKIPNENRVDENQEIYSSSFLIYFSMRVASLQIPLYMYGKMCMVVLVYCVLPLQNLHYFVASSLSQYVCAWLIQMT